MLQHLTRDVPGCKLLVALGAGVGPVTVVQVLVLHQDVLVAEPPVTDVTLVRFLACQGHRKVIALHYMTV